MFIKSEAELIYEGQGVADNGSPVSLQKSVVVRVDELETFSSNYYNEQQRNMRLSRNLVVPTYLTNDIIEDDVVYELMYVNYQDKNYRVRNILKYSSRQTGRTRQKMILDIQEVR